MAENIIEGMEHDPANCPKCCLLAVLEEAEQVDLVRRVREVYGDDECADELETWLAVNIPRIKAQARMEEAKWWWGMYTEGAPAVCDKRIAAFEAQAKEKP